MVLLPTACKTEGEELAVWLEIRLADGKSLADTTIESSPRGETIAITIASNTAWCISTSAEWIAPQQSSGEGSQSVMLEVGTTTQSRSGVVVVQLAETEQVRRSFNIVQHAEEPEGAEDNESAGDNGSGDNGGSDGSGDNEGSSGSGNENGSEGESGSDDIVMTPDGADNEGGSGGSNDEGSTGGNEGGSNNEGNSDDSDSSPDDDIVMTPDDPSDSGDTDDSEGNGDAENDESKENEGTDDSDSGNDSTGTEGSEDNNDPDTPDNNQGGNESSGDNDNNNEGNGNNGNESGNGNEGSNGNNENNDETDTPVGDYTVIDHVSELAAGEYFIGGYQDDVLHLATEGMTVGHCNTTPYTLSADFSLTPVADATATLVYLEPSNEANGYYIRFSTQGYLTATAAGAGKLTFSNSRNHFWRFANHPDGGFILSQSGEIDVKLIISPHARINALLRSVAGEEDGNAVLLFKRNNP